MVRKAGGRLGPITPTPPLAHLGLSSEDHGSFRSQPWTRIHTELPLLPQDRTGLAAGSGPRSMNQARPASFPGRTMPSAQSHLSLCTGDSERCLLI